MRRVVSGLVLLLGALTAPSSAQSLAVVDSLVQDGRMAEARSALLEWDAAGLTPSREDRQQALWLRGLLTLAPDEAATSYLRLVVEYPGGSYAEEALLRLATLAELRGDTLEAEGFYRQLVRDHPESLAVPRAEAWLAAYADSVLPVGRRGDDPPRSDRAPRPPPTTEESRRILVGEFTVQIGAFTRRENADALAARVRESGFRPRVVRVEGSPLFRVRVGRFRSTEDAEALRDRIQAAGFEAGVARDATRERTG